MPTTYAIVIPARFESFRLPGKPLIELCGTPMIVRTYRQCVKACPPEKVYVATDSGKIRAVCEQHGIRVLMTSSQCLTGTDRVAECSDQLDAELFINVQGDEPVFDPEDITALLKAAQDHPGEVLNGVCEVSAEDQYRSGSIPKVVTRADGRLLYMSRAAIPSTKRFQFVKAWRQICAYAFPREALKAFRDHGRKTPLEQIEDIEILRFLELGWEVRMIPLSSQSVAVDMPEDIERAEKAIRERGL